MKHGDFLLRNQVVNRETAHELAGYAGSENEPCRVVMNASCPGAVGSDPRRVLDSKCLKKPFVKVVRRQIKRIDFV